MNNPLTPQSKLLINLNALARNLKQLKSKCSSDIQLMAVVKADAYGHGAVNVAETALENGASFLAVARIHEALELRNASINAPILLFGDILPSQVEWLIENDIRITIGSIDAARQISDAVLNLKLSLKPSKFKIKVHIKADTGMGRLGFVVSEYNIKEIVDYIIAVSSFESLEIEGIYTHFANADTKDKSDVKAQIQKFNLLLDALEECGIKPKICHAANSAAIIGVPEGHFNMVRAGIAMYGLKPSDEVGLSEINLEPVMSVVSKIIHLKSVSAGFKISYGSTYITEHPTKIATVPIGYADGYSRLLSSKAEMLVKGVRCRVLGRICMDYTMIDVGHITDVKLGDDVVVMGKQGDDAITADEIAEHINTINYEVVCCFSRRMPVVISDEFYTDNSLLLSEDSHINQPYADKPKIHTKEFNITGVVQGVGFRPFIFQLAKLYNLKGEVFNTGNGVTVIIQGFLDSIDNFSKDIEKKKPPLAIISKIESHHIESYQTETEHIKFNKTESEHLQITNYEDFFISKSRIKESNSSNINFNSNISIKSNISPDVSVCDDCLKEMVNPLDRRFGYPFINCTNCGPRYTIIKDIPYDRPKTSMNVFKMCRDCQNEYDNPLDRRFHAQPNGCPVCGPHIFITDNLGNKIASSSKTSSSKALEFAAEVLKDGKILAIKGLGGFHLAVDAMNKEAVLELRKRKQRPDKPFALMVKSIEEAFKITHISLEEKELLESYHRPIVLLLKRQNDDACVIAPENPFLGIMLPYTPLHYLLLEKGPSIVVMTSGNRSSEPLSIDNQDALNAFSHIADYFLLHNRDIYFRADDSIMQVQDKIPRFFRRSRGYAPLPIPIILDNNDNINVLGCGAGLKNTVCLLSGNRAFLSQHIGDLENEKAFEFYKQSINHLKKIFNIEPDVIAHDLHPDYLSTKYAESLLDLSTANNNNKHPSFIPESSDSPAYCSNIIFIPVQHHHAHAVSCMAENGISGDVIAITLDGTGLGTDGNIWGGEILVCSEMDFKRKAHLKYIPMPGGDKAVQEPWRMAVSYLYEAFGDDILTMKIPFLDSIRAEIGENNLFFIIQMIKKKLNTPLTSSCGRLFDAAASLCLLRHKITFESQAAIELQSKSRVLDIKSLDNYGQYDFVVGGDTNDKSIIIDIIPSIIEIVKDICSNKSIELISSKFHKTVIEGFVCAAKKVSFDTGIKRVVLSGGVFNNIIILSGMIFSLEKEGFTVYSHSRVPSGDGGISLGQAVIARMKTAEKEAACV